MKILVLGSGGREYSMLDKLGQSSGVDKLYCAPGNDAMRRLPKVECLNIKADNIPVLLAFAISEGIDLTIPGPEDPLVKGVANAFKKAGLKIFGPDKEAAELEGSKVFAKHFMFKYGIPTAQFTVFESTEAIREYLRIYTKVPAKRFPLVLKMDGLAGGKGVRVCKDMQSALAFLAEIDAGRFKDAGSRIILEDCLSGEEASYIVMVDKKGHFLSLASSQDHKRVGDDDMGENTGGMGAYSPAPVVTEEIEKKIRKIVRRVINGMQKEGKLFMGFLYLGLMIKKGKLSVLEFNVRLGDPETQPIMVRMLTDFAELIMAAVNGDLDKHYIKWDAAPAVCIVKCAEGYPGAVKTGDEVFGYEGAEGIGANVSFAGVKLNAAFKLVTSSGRIVAITGRGVGAGDFAGAQKKAYLAAGMIHFRGQHFRTDIAQRAIER